MSSYTEDEIIALFRGAKDKQKQILILVDLTLKDENEIRRILGYEQVKKPYKARYPEDERSWKLANGYLECENIGKYAASQGMTENQLHYQITKLRRMGYNIPHKKKRSKKDGIPKTVC